MHEGQICSCLRWDVHLLSSDIGAPGSELFGLMLGLTLYVLQILGFQTWTGTDTIGPPLILRTLGWDWNYNSDFPGHQACKVADGGLLSLHNHLD